MIDAVTSGLVLLVSLTLAPGVSYREYAWRGAAGPSRVYVVEAANGRPDVTWVTTSPGQGGRVVGLTPVVRQAQESSTFFRPAVPVAAINGDFWTPPPLGGVPYNLQVRRGELVSSPNGLPAVGLLPDGRPVAGVPRLTGRVVVTRSGSSRPLTGVNKPLTVDALELYTPSWSERTHVNGGVEAVIRQLEPPLPLRPGTRYRGRVERVTVPAPGDEGEGPQGETIPADGVVAAGAGEGGRWLREALAAGDSVEIQVSLGDPWDQVVEAIGGSLRLLEAGRVGPQVGDNPSIHPRSAVGYGPSSLYLVAVDGRQAPYSAGVTLLELARILLELGATDAINLDGGGSTTLAIRQPGDAGLGTVNRPSDGFDRSVGNALAIFTRAVPTGRLAALDIRPRGAVILTGSRQAFTAFGVDENGFPVTLDPGGVEWGIEPDRTAERPAGGTVAGEIVPNGLLTAGEVPVRVVARAAGVEASVRVEVVSRLDRLEVRPNPVVLDVDGMLRPLVTGWLGTQPVVVSSDVLGWAVMPGATAAPAPASVEADGTIRSGPAPGEATIRVGWPRLDSRPGGGAAAVWTDVRVIVGRPPSIIDDFEDIGRLAVSTARARARVSAGMRPLPVRSGTFSARLDYDFSGSSPGTRAAYLTWRSGPIRLDGRPLRLGLWVYGDGAGHWLRATLYDARRTSGMGVTVDFTPKGGLDWTGWRYVEAVLPEDLAPPIALRWIYVAETDGDRMGSGTLYFDDLQAIYSTSRTVPVDPGPAR